MKPQEECYAGDGRKFYKITRAIEQSNITPLMQKEILDEIEKLSLSNQRLRNVLGKIVSSFEETKHLLITK